MTEDLETRVVKRFLLNKINIKGKLCIFLYLHETPVQYTIQYFIHISQLILSYIRQITINTCRFLFNVYMYSNYGKRDKQS